MSGYLLDLFVQRERVQALKAMVKSWVVFVLYLLSPLLISLFVVDKFGSRKMVELKDMS